MCYSKTDNKDNGGQNATIRFCCILNQVHSEHKSQYVAILTWLYKKKT